MVTTVTSPDDTTIVPSAPDRTYESFYHGDIPSLKISNIVAGQLYDAFTNASIDVKGMVQLFTANPAFGFFFPLFERGEGDRHFTFKGFAVIHHLHIKGGLMGAVPKDDDETFGIEGTVHPAGALNIVKIDPRCFAFYRDEAVECLPMEEVLKIKSIENLGAIIVPANCPKIRMRSTMGIPPFLMGLIGAYDGGIITNVSEFFVDCVTMVENFVDNTVSPLVTLESFAPFFQYLLYFTMLDSQTDDEKKDNKTRFNWVAPGGDDPDVMAHFRLLKTQINLDVLISKAPPLTLTPLSLSGRTGGGAATSAAAAGQSASGSSTSTKSVTPPAQQSVMEVLASNARQQTTILEKMMNSQLVDLSIKTRRGFKKFPAIIQTMILKASTNFEKPTPPKEPSTRYSDFLNMEKHTAKNHIKSELTSNTSTLVINTNVADTLYGADFTTPYDNDYTCLSLFQLGPYVPPAGETQGVVNERIDEEYRMEQKLTTDKDAKAAATVILTTTRKDVNVLKDYIQNGIDVYTFVFTAESAIVWSLRQVLSHINANIKTYQYLATSDDRFCTFVLLIVVNRIWRFLNSCKNLPDSDVDYTCLEFTSILFNKIIDKDPIVRVIPRVILSALEATRPKKSVTFDKGADGGGKRAAGDDGGGGLKPLKKKPKKNNKEQDEDIVPEWLKRDHENFSLFFSKRTTAPKINGQDVCLNRWIGGHCKQGDRCTRKKNHVKLDPTSDDYKKMDKWVKTCRGEE